MEYAPAREPFGKPTPQPQMVRDRISKMRANVGTPRLLLGAATENLANASEESRMYSSLAKGYACDKSVETARHAVELYGGNGLSTDYPLERYYRDAPTLTVPHGAEEIQKLLVGYELTDMAAYS